MSPKDSGLAQSWHVFFGPSRLIWGAFGESKPAWREHVTVVTGDMRQWKAPVKADIIVSELLGSWGDNEVRSRALLAAPTPLDRSHERAC